MALLDLAYARALLSVAPLPDIARAVVRRGGRMLVRRALPQPVTVEDRRLAADALGRAPRLFTDQSLIEICRAQHPTALADARVRAEAILAHQIELFGRMVTLPSRIDWHADPLGNGRHRADGARRLQLSADGPDPKWLWELARAGHLVELGAAARLHPDLAARARSEVESQIDGFLAQARVGRGIHYASPLEVALRTLHWLGALELCGGARTFPRPFVERLGAGLVADARFLAAHPEDSGVVPANHLLGDWVGLYVLGLALEGAPGARGWIELGARGIRREAARQVGSDGAHFEASTGYHRFALELLLAAHRASRSAGRDLHIADTLHAMFEYVRGYSTPAGTEPAIGDGDDAQILPVCARSPRDHSALLDLGVALFSDPALRPPVDRPVAIEALWMAGPEAQRTWSWVPPRAALASASYPSGGVHVLRSPSIYLALRAGSYGQRGVGGHAHNDQLSIVVWGHGRPLIVDPGTGSYATDPVLRDRFRGTAAHATLVVDGAEQSPIVDGRPFALLDHARTSPALLEDVGHLASLSAEHRGYARLPSRVLHARKVTLHRELDAIYLEDTLRGRGEASIALRFPLAPGLVPRIGATDGIRARVAALSGELGIFDVERAVELCEDSRPRAALVPLASTALQPRTVEGLFSAHYGTVERQSLVTFVARLKVPTTTAVVLLLL